MRDLLRFKSNRGDTDVMKGPFRKYPVLESVVVHCRVHFWLSLSKNSVNGRDTQLMGLRGWWRVGLVSVVWGMEMYLIFFRGEWKTLILDVFPTTDETRLLSVLLTESFTIHRSNGRVVRIRHSWNPSRVWYVTTTDREKSNNSRGGGFRFEVLESGSDVVIRGSTRDTKGGTKVSLKRYVLGIFKILFSTVRVRFLGAFWKSE